MLNDVVVLNVVVVDLDVAVALDVAVDLEVAVVRDVFMLVAVCRNVSTPVPLEVLAVVSLAVP